MPENKDRESIEKEKREIEMRIAGLAAMAAVLLRKR